MTSFFNMSYPYSLKYDDYSASLCQYINETLQMKYCEQFENSNIPTIVGFENENYVFGEDIPSSVTNLISLIGVPYDSDQFRYIKPFLDLKNIKTREEVINNPNRPKEIEILFNGEWYSPIFLLSKNLEWLKTLLIEKVNNQHCGIPYPANFNQRQKMTLKESFIKAGFPEKNLHFISDLQASALTLCMSPENLKKSFKNMIVINFGYITSSAVVLSVSTINGVPHFDEKIIEEKSCLGSYSIFRALYDHVIQLLSEDAFPNLDPEENWDEINRIIKSIMNAINKLILNPNSTQTILRSNFKISGKKLERDIKLDKQLFETITSPIIEQFKSLLNTIFDDYSISKNDIDAVCLSGTYTQIWKFKEMIQNYFEIAPFFYPDIQNMAAKGACLYAASITPGMNVIEEVYCESSEVLNKSLNIEVYNYSNKSERLLYPVMIHNIHHYGDTVMQVFPSLNNKTTSYIINIYEGNSKFLRDGRLLQTYIHNNIVPADAGEPQLEVYFDLNQNGILDLTSRDVAHTEPKGTSFLYTRRKVKETVIEDELNKKQQMKAERMCDILTFRNLTRYVDNDLTDLYDDANFTKIVDTRRLNGSIYTLHYYIKSKIKVTSMQIHSLILEIRGLVANYYAQMKLNLPEILTLRQENSNISEKETPETVHTEYSKKAK